MPNLNLRARVCVRYTLTDLVDLAPPTADLKHRLGGGSVERPEKRHESLGRTYSLNSFASALRSGGKQHHHGAAAHGASSGVAASDPASAADANDDDAAAEPDEAAAGAVAGSAGRVSNVGSSESVSSSVSVSGGGGGGSGGGIGGRSPWDLPDATEHLRRTLRGLDRLRACHRGRLARRRQYHVARAPQGQVLQFAVRRWLVKRHAAAKWRAALLLGHACRRLLRTVRLRTRAAAALRCQRWWRGARCRHAFGAVRAAVVGCQAARRGSLARQRVSLAWSRDLLGLRRHLVGASLTHGTPTGGAWKQNNINTERFCGLVIKFFLFFLPGSPCGLCGHSRYFSGTALRRLSGTAAPSGCCTRRRRRRGPPRRGNKRHRHQEQWQQARFRRRR